MNHDSLSQHSLSQHSLSKRRSFFSRAGAGLASLAAVSGVVFPNKALAKQKASGAGWQPARHEKDDWFDKVPGKHRLVFDTTTFKGMGEAILFASNYIVANKNDYGLDSSELAIVIIARHGSTPFAFSDAMWAKYGKVLADMSGAQDPHTKEAPTVNIFNASGYGRELPSFGTTIGSLTKQGVQFAVCSMATMGVAGEIGRQTGVNGDPVFKELTANLIGNARMVPAGIVAVNRAQERGYTLVTT
jgi:intracellular sulfur oxidation DsrE/DsrF family protein